MKTHKPSPQPATSLRPWILWTVVAPVGFGLLLALTPLTTLASHDAEVDREWGFTYAAQDAKADAWGNLEYAEMFCGTVRYRMERKPGGAGLYRKAAACENEARQRKAQLQRVAYGMNEAMKEMYFDQGAPKGSPAARKYAAARADWNTFAKAVRAMCEPARRLAKTAKALYQQSGGDKE